MTNEHPEPEFRLADFQVDAGAALTSQAEAMAEIDCGDWSTVVVSSAEEAATLVFLAKKGQRAVGLDELVHGKTVRGESLLLLGEAPMRAAGALRAAGAVALSGAYMPSGYELIGQWVEQTAKETGYYQHGSDDEMLQLWSMHVIATAHELRPEAKVHPSLGDGRPARRRRKTIADLMAMPPMRWMRPGLIPSVGCGFIVGGPNAGKSTFALGLALASYHGLNHLGVRCKPTSVLLFVGEGVPGLGKRIDAWQREHGPLIDVEGRYFEIVDDQPPLCTREGQEALYRSVREAEADHGHPPGLVIIDTLSSLWGGDTEDKSEVAGPFMRSINAMVAELGIVVLIAHHVTKGGRNRDGKLPPLSMDSLRGSTAFTGAADFILGVEDMGDKHVRLSVLKQKEAERGAPLHMRMHAITLGKNEDGDDVTGAFLVPDKARGPEADPDDERARQWEMLRDAMADAVRVMEQLGGRSTSKELVIGQMIGKKDMRRSGFDRCIDDGKILMRGTPRDAVYYLPEHPHMRREREGQQ